MSIENKSFEHIYCPQCNTIIRNVNLISAKIGEISYYCEKCNIYITMSDRIEVDSHHNMHTLLSPLYIVNNEYDEINYENNEYNVLWTPSRQQLTISRKDGEPVESWYDIWSIKNLVVGKDTTAVEIYPSENDLINDGNQRHLFILETKLNEKISFQNAYNFINNKRRNK